MAESTSPPPLSTFPPPHPLGHLDRDLPAGLVVFLVATPLCLGIAQASGAPLLSGMVSGIIGGLVVSSLSRSPLSVSGPAAGLAVLVAAGIQELGFPGFLVATVLSGLLQLLVGVLRLGSVAHFFPNAVIKGMLAAIGILIVLKQIPHALGYDAEWEIDEALVPADGLGVFTLIGEALGAFTPGAILVTATCGLAYVLWPRLQVGWLRFVPAPLVAVVLGGGLAALLPWLLVEVSLTADHLVSLPVPASPLDLVQSLVLPDFSRIGEPAIWRTALVLAIVASVETLLSIEAVDRLDPHRRISPPNRELVAQGVGNTLSGLIGGLPITSVIVRSSANVQAGAETRISAIVHGVFLLLGLLFLSGLLNQVPLAALAVVLIGVGLKLSTPSLWVGMWRAGVAQFVPFAVTVGGILTTDLLTGVVVGLLVGLAFAVRRQQQNAVLVTRRNDDVLIRFTKDMSFLQKARVKDVLSSIADGSRLLIDRERVDFVDDDIEEILAEFVANAGERGITVEESLTPAVARRRELLAPGT